MSRREIETILKQVEQLLATAGTLPAEAKEAVEKLLNVVESLCSHNSDSRRGTLERGLDHESIAQVGI